MQYNEIIDQVTEKLKKAKIPSARLDAELITVHASGHDRAWLIAHRQDKISDGVIRKVTNLTNKRATRQPLSYVLGSREFYGLNFKIDARALTPRIETELIVDKIIASAPNNGYFLDIGTGSGAIAIAVAKNRSDLKIWASDISSEALDLARENTAKLLDNNNHINVVQSNLFDNITSTFDAIAANLPYVADESQGQTMPEVSHEPSVALFGGQAGLELYKQFFQNVSKHLNPCGTLYTESDPWQHQALKSMAHSAGLKLIFEDYFILGFEKS